MVVFEDNTCDVLLIKEVGGLKTEEILYYCCAWLGFHLIIFSWISNLIVLDFLTEGWFELETIGFTTFVSWLLGVESLYKSATQYKRVRSIVAWVEWGGAGSFAFCILGSSVRIRWTCVVKILGIRNLIVHCRAVSYYWYSLVWVVGC